MAIPLHHHLNLNGATPRTGRLLFWVITPGVLYIGRNSLDADHFLQTKAWVTAANSPNETMWGGHSNLSILLSLIIPCYRHMKGMSKAAPPQGTQAAPQSTQAAPAAAGVPSDLPKCNYVSQDIRYQESLRYMQYSTVYPFLKKSTGVCSTSNKPLLLGICYLDSCLSCGVGTIR